MFYKATEEFNNIEESWKVNSISGGHDFTLSQNVQQLMPILMFSRHQKELNLFGKEGQPSDGF